MPASVHEMQILGVPFFIIFVKFLFNYERLYWPIINASYYGDWSPARRFPDLTVATFIGVNGTTIVLVCPVNATALLYYKQWNFHLFCQYNALLCWKC